MRLAFLGKNFLGASMATKTAVVAIGLVALEVGTIMVVKVVNNSPLPASGTEVTVTDSYTPGMQTPSTGIPGQDSLLGPGAGAAGETGRDGTASGSEGSALQEESVDEGLDETMGEDSTRSGEKNIVKPPGTSPPVVPSEVLVPVRLMDLSVISPPT